MLRACPRDETPPPASQRSPQTLSTPQRDVINEMPLYPTEGVLWDEAQIPSVNYSGESTLALPKLNLQFLTPHDYLLRNFNL
jgi:hypothetical protein